MHYRNYMPSLQSFKLFKLTNCIEYKDKLSYEQDKVSSLVCQIVFNFVLFPSPATIRGNVSIQNVLYWKYTISRLSMVTNVAIFRVWHWITFPRAYTVVVGKLTLTVTKHKNFPWVCPWDFKHLGSGTTDDFPITTYDNCLVVKSKTTTELAHSSRPGVPRGILKSRVSHG